ncbi:DUF6112 family protein [Promicromonospora vindobonensis]|uniref:DUF6112 family protein n=1 Tax=Promicromonospora vindobonensis TaxID=195748 RepID=A0ABW5VW84_9MICO
MVRAAHLPSADITALRENRHADHLHTAAHAASVAATHSAEHTSLIATKLATRLPQAVVALIIAAIVWAFGANSSNPHLAGRGKTGILVAAASGVVCGAAVALINFGWDLGQQI